MPLYFTHIHEEDHSIIDQEGQEFADDAAATEDAKIAAIEMLAEKLLADELLDGQSLEVCDASGDPSRRSCFENN